MVLRLFLRDCLPVRNTEYKDGIMWNRCDVCGRFIALKEFEEGTAMRNLLTPDSYLTNEEWETIHFRCDEWDSVPRKPS